jgi:glycosyltransferase involved in cell wall biosynthesis
VKIALVGTCLHPVPPPAAGALELQVFEQARALAQRGHEVHVLTVGEDSGPRLAGLAFHRLARPYSAGPSGVLRLLLAERAFNRAVYRELAQLAPAVVHFHARGPCVAWLEQGQGPLVFQAHNWKRAEGLSRRPLGVRRAAAWYSAALELRAARGAGHVLAVSAFLRERIVADTGLPPERISELANVVDQERFRPAVGNRANPREVLYVGRLAEEKGLLTLIGAVARVPRAELTIIGPTTGGTEFGAYARACRRRVEELGLEKRVVFAGELAHSALPAYYQRAALVAVPSLWGEPCGLVALEALACGTPVLASRVGGLTAAIEPGVRGQLCPPGDEAAWALALEQALGNEELRRNCASAGPSWIAARHTAAELGERLETLYTALLTAARKAP